MTAKLTEACIEDWLVWKWLSSII